jgi:predicted nucleic acid-binding protein
VGERRVTDWVIVDTDILIDVGRGDETAIAYLETLERSKGLAVSAVTYMELIVGCKNKREQQAVKRFVRRFEVIGLTEAITEKAVELLLEYRLSHGLLIADALIAATAIERNKPLISKNQRDYRFIGGLDLLPYPPG